MDIAGTHQANQLVAVIFYSRAWSPLKLCSLSGFAV